MGVVVMEYPCFEKGLASKINNLMDEWEKVASGEFTTDGFYPYYTVQKYRILFIGRESRGLSGCDYIPVLHDAYKINSIDGKHINKDMFHRRLFFIAFGLLNDFPEWKDVPYPQDITHSFATQDGISFAFMNISKISNEADYYPSNWANIQKSKEDAITKNRNFLQEEISLLEPDIIIGSGVDDIHKIVENGQLLLQNQWLSLYLLNICSKNVLYFSTYHFTARKIAGGKGVRDYDSFYLPIKEC